MWKRRSSLHKPREDNNDWNHLIQDAKRRGALFKTSEERYQKDVTRILKLNPAVPRTSTSHAGRPGVDRHAAGSPTYTPPAHELPHQMVVQPPQRIVAHPAVDIRQLQNRLVAPVAPSASRGKQQDPRLARRQEESSKDANPSISGVHRPSSGNPYSRSQTKPSSSSSMVGVKRPTHPLQRPPHSAQSGTRERFSRDQDYRDNTRFDRNQDAKKRKIS
ncbi:hypothetical protein GDO81_025131 [Engystomops pustulosus]|uniref:Uncharacterized protein n=1 Tax=Engystomops pustulosus TaxID=76066 RepID=A0AAV6ZV28_ENGPU|nr:hypothetical protein GDO81_025131 [Engystomops pustulosus]